MPRFEYDGPNSEGVTDRDVEMGFIRKNMPRATLRRYDTDFTFMVWGTKACIIEAYVFDDGRPTVWYFSAKETTADFGWRKVITVGENTGVAARWIQKRVKRFEMEEDSARLVHDFVLCLMEMKCSDKYSATWECARSDARDRLADLCDLAGVPADQVIGFDI